MSIKKILALSFMGLLLLSGCEDIEKPTSQQTTQNTTQVSQADHVGVVASFYPLFELVQRIGGEKGEFRVIIPSGVEPHDYEPTPQQINDLYKADLVVLNGAGLEPWGEKIKTDLEKNGVGVLILADTIPLLQQLNENSQQSNSNQVYDPHFWLDPITYLEEGQLITQKISQISPSNASYYQKNFEILKTDLQNLNKDFENGLKDCNSRTIVTSHAAFAYLAKRYNLEMMAITGLSPDEEPSPKKLSELAKMIKEKNIHYVFTETLVSPRIAQTLADEANAQTLVLNPLEGLTDDEIKGGKNYFTVMEENLKNLKTGLGCK